MNRKRLQVLTNNGWEWVFCLNPVQGIITTQDYKKSLLERDLEYFQCKKADRQYRVITQKEVKP